MMSDRQYALVLWEEINQPVWGRMKPLIVLRGKKKEVVKCILFEVPITHNLHTSSLVDLDLLLARKSPSFCSWFFFLKK